MTFVLHPLSHYNYIIEPYAQFLLSLLEYISIDFPSHFILSFIDVYRDTTTRDKLIFPSAITQILCHFSVPFPVSPHFYVIGAIDIATIQRSEAQLWLQCPKHRRQLLPFLQLHPPLLLLLPWVVWLLMQSRCSFSTWMLALIHSVMSCVKGTLVLVVLPDGRLALVVSWNLPLLLPRHPRTMTMTLTTMMMLRIGMLAHPVMMRCLLDVLTPLSLVTKRGESFWNESSHIKGEG